ncbi:MAG: PilT/PilU family type 4a pilus ATPase [Candidatus Pacebacteria bacterium]|jgi:twitching motility protein PilT|nr:PilT/PilU family type 4a pilus ATPase [Candidatus Paceibacterota bacterium]MDD5722047.1 PilT/PilU family type 4a pilus ATPase [Candidatus Paceibacterota bacterium]
MDYQKKMAELMVLAAQQGASDLHLGVGKHPTVRIDGNLVPISNEAILTPEMTAGLIGALLTEEQQDKLISEREIDFAFAFENKIRFRVNVYFQKGYLSAALRLIPVHIRTIEELGLPSILHEFTKYQQGFFLVVGPAGHGKTTTLAALIDEINHKRMEHIITIEEPIEYTFSQDRALIDQREVGTDTVSFHRGLRSVLRQDPDVIMIGEMRDPESISIALTAAETGHLVFSTLHTNSASQTIDRIVDSFPGSQQSQISSQLATTLIGIVSERLIPRISGGRVPACEVMFANSAIKNLIREKKSYQIDLVIETSVQEGMVSLNRSLMELVRKREISLETAENYSLNPTELRQLLG